MQYVLLTSIQYVYSYNNTDLFSYRYTRLLQHTVHECVGVHLLQRALHLVDDRYAGLLLVIGEQFAVLSAQTCYLDNDARGKLRADCRTGA